MMNRIWLCKWWNEDGYGPTREVSVVVQGDDMGNFEAKDVAKRYLKKNKIETDFEKYDNFITQRIDDKEVLAVNYIHIC